MKMKKALWILAACSLFAGGYANGGSPGETVYRDDFSDYSLVSDGSPKWMPQSGEWVVANGVMRQNKLLGSETLTFLDNYSFDDCTIKVRFKPSGAKQGVRAAGIVFRARDYRNFYYVHFDCRNSQVILVLHTDHTTWAEICRRKKVTIRDGAWNRAEVSCKGDLIEITLNGEKVLEGHDRRLKVGRVGLRAGQGRIEFDDFEVRGNQVENNAWKFQRESVDTTTPRLAAERSMAAQDCGFFPVMVKLGGNHLGAVIRGGAGHTGIGGRLEWIESRDGGKTWSRPRVIVDSPVDDRNPALMKLPDGRLLLLYSEASTYKPDGSFDIASGSYELFLTESADLGKTWTPKRAIPAPDFKNPSGYGQGIVLSNGDLIIPLYANRTGFLRSRDQGKTWQAITICKGYSETAIIEIAPGKLFAAMRDNGLSGSFSDDFGETWSQPQRITERELHPASLVKLSNGNLLMCYGVRVPPFGVGAALSRDNGKTWSPNDRVLLAWDGQSPDCGYPSAVQLDSGEIALLYYALGSEVLPWKVQAFCVRFSLDELERTLQNRQSTGRQP